MTASIDPRQPKCFLAVAELRHFRRAADRLLEVVSAATEELGLTRLRAM